MGYLSQEVQGFVRCGTKDLHATGLVTIETHVKSGCRTCRSRSAPNPASATVVGLCIPWASRWFVMHPHPPPPPLQPTLLTHNYSAMAPGFPALWCVTQSQSVVVQLNATETTHSPDLQSILWHNTGGFACPVACMKLEHTAHGCESPIPGLDTSSQTCSMSGNRPLPKAAATIFLICGVFWGCRVRSEF